MGSSCGLTQRFKFIVPQLQSYMAHAPVFPDPKPLLSFKNFKPLVNQVFDFGSESAEDAIRNEV